MADDSSTSDVGQRYAQALFELARDGDALGPVDADLRALGGALSESADLKRLIASPAFDADAKARGLDAVVAAGNAHPLTRKFIGLIARNRRSAALGAVITAFQRMLAEHRGVVAAQVTSAAPLSEAQLQAVTAALQASLGKTPDLDIRVDPAILGGLKVRVGSRLYDASLKTRLDQMKLALQRA